MKSAKSEQVCILAKSILTPLLWSNKFKNICVQDPAISNTPRVAPGIGVRCRTLYVYGSAHVHIYTYIYTPVAALHAERACGFVETK